MKSEIPIESQREILLNECQVKLAPYGVIFEHAVITNKVRDTDFVFVRALVAFVIKRQGYNLSQIARIFDMKSHASVINLLGYDKKKQGWRRKQYRIITKAIKAAPKPEPIPEPQ
jgi:hypothetical protein